MVPLSNEGAKHFCKHFSVGATPALDMRDLYDNVLSKRKSFKEGEQVFNQYRDSVLREVDRSFFLGVSCFRRALDMFSAASVFWAHVSLYYSSWFAAHSILGMYGCWVHGTRRVVEVKSNTPGSQEFGVSKNYPSLHTGPHQFFWDAYYNAMKAVVLWAKPSLHLAVKPISNSHTWAIDKRNLVNYQSVQAFKSMNDYNITFDATKFPSCLQGDVATQFQLARTLLLFCADLAVEFGLHTDVYSALGSRSKAMKDLIYKETPAKLAHHSEEARLTI